MKKENHNFDTTATIAHIRGQIERMKIGALNDVEQTLRESGRHVEVVGADTFMPTGELTRVIALPFSGTTLTVTVGNSHAHLVVRSDYAGIAPSVVNLCDPHWLAILETRIAEPGSERRSA